MKKRIDTKKLTREQTKLSSQIVLKDEFDINDIKLIAGCNQSYIDENTLLSTIVVLDFNTFKLVDCSYFKTAVEIPYIPGFLSYRESPAIVRAFSHLENRPDIILVQGNGIIHLRKIGIASHLGLLLDIPTIGVAKKLLLGEVKDGKVIIKEKSVGFEIKTRDVSNPIYVSPGHKVSMSTTKKIIEKCSLGHKLPEPMHIAHKKSLEYINKHSVNGKKDKLL